MSWASVSGGVGRLTWLGSPLDSVTCTWRPPGAAQNARHSRPPSVIRLRSWSITSSEPSGRTVRAQESIGVWNASR
ncbi:hypothetical protein [Kitasatospora fiedleri]|uniref:hypothetical protein n=1 Tax=Kitasatospora fiedleri TaxID=2991545 RepID=UPI00249A892C|nr:hypothetical protein [Kitasatospora fiedleri]